MALTDIEAISTIVCSEELYWSCNPLSLSFCLTLSLFLFVFLFSHSMACKTILGAQSDTLKCLSHLKIKQTHYRKLETNVVQSLYNFQDMYQNNSWYSTWLNHSNLQSGTINIIQPPCNQKLFLCRSLAELSLYQIQFKYTLAIEAQFE